MTIASWVGDYIGLPFKEHGRDKSGLDCWGLVRLIYAQQFGIMLPSLVERYDSTLPRNALQLGALVTDIAKTDWIQIPQGQEREGDVIVLRYNRHPMHVGVVVDKGYMIHVEQGTDAAICCYDSLRFRRSVTGLYRHASR